MTYSMTYSMTRKEGNKEKKIRYKAYSFRLDERTYKTLQEIREREQLSWNRLILKIINSYNK